MVKTNANGPGSPGRFCFVGATGFEGELTAPETPSNAANRSDEAPSAATTDGDSRGARAEAIADLYRHASRLATSGDLAAARILHRAVGELLGTDTGQAGDVVDLRDRRGSR